MNYLTTENGTPEPINLRSWVKAKANEAGQSWPEIWNEADEAVKAAFLAKRSVYPYTIDPKPSIDPTTQRVIDGGFTQDAEGNWSRGWIVETIPEAERAAAAQAEADRLDEGRTDVDLALAILDMVLDSRNSNSQPQPDLATVRQGLKDRVLHYARKRRGLT